MTKHNPMRGSIRFFTVVLLAGCCLIAACRSSGDRTTWQTLSDYMLANNVRNHLEDNPRVGPFPISVAARDGVVTLTGTVDSSEASSTAAGVARSVPGVRRVDNQLEVK